MRKEITTIPLHVVIPTHGRSALLAETLDSLGACGLPKNYGETVVVENGEVTRSRDVVEAAAGRHPHLRIRYVHTRIANKSHALNTALESVSDGLVVFFDDDIRIAPGSLVAYAEAAMKHGDGHYYGGPFTVRYEARPPDWLIRSFPVSATGRDVSEMNQMDFLLGFNWAAFAGDIREAGGFDPAYGPGSPTGATGQETELQNRLKSRGYKRVVVDDAWVEHYVPRSRASEEWVIERRHRLGVSSGQRLSGLAGTRALGRAFASACRSAFLIPVWAMLRDRQRVFGHRLNIAKFAGLLQGVRMRRTSPAARV